MELREAIIHALNGNAILFLGSGFSIGATKENNGLFQTAGSLAHKLLKECGFKDDELIEDIGSASMVYQKEKGEHGLVEFLRNEFTAIESTDEQNTVAQINWQRVYTTNYDNVYELAANKNHKKIQSVVLSDKTNDFKNKQNLCIHINGDIKRLTIEKLQSEFKLTNASYLADDFNKSEWITLFRSDLHTAKAIFFVGYSMKYDIDIQRIIFATPDIQSKTFFVLHDKTSRLDEIIITQFGTPLPINTEEFANEIVNVKKDFIPCPFSMENYLCFKKNKISTIPPSIHDSDEFDLLVKGEYYPDKLYYSWINNEDYFYSFRRTKQEYILECISKGDKRFLIHSDLGNGKTIFIETIATLLVQQGYKVYFFYKDRVTFGREIEKICQKMEKIVIIFEDYMSHFDNFKTLKPHLTDQILIVSERSASNDLGYDSLSEMFGKFKLINLNQLDYNEIHNFVKILDHYGYWTYLSSERIDKKEEFIKQTCRGQIKNVILKLLNSTTIINRFENLIKSIKEKDGFYEAVLFILIANVANLDLDIEDLSYSLNIDVLNSPKFKRDPHVQEFVDFDTYCIRAKSSIISQVLLQQIFDSTVVTDVMLSIFKKLNEHHHDNKAKRFLRKMMIFTNVQQVLNKDDSSYKYNLLRYYESIKALSSCEKNPHFWLQYAIVKLSEHEYDKAHLYFESAYSYAKKIEGFDTYQIDNHYARFILENEIKFGTNSTCMQAFSHAHSILTDSRHKTEVRYYPYRVAQNYYPFYERFYSLITPKEQNYFVRCCEEIIERLNSYIKSSSTTSHSKDIRRAKESLHRIFREIEKQSKN